MAGIVDLTVDQGATFRRTIIYNDPVTGDPVNLTGYTARMHLRTVVTSEDIVLELTTENGRLTIDPLIGKIIVEVEATAMEDVVAGRYVYDLELVSADDPPVVMRLIEGRIKVKAEVTRDD